MPDAPDGRPKPSLLAFIRNGRLSPKIYLCFALGAFGIRFVLFVLTQTIAAAGSPLNERLSLDGDLLWLFIAVETAFRARDAGLYAIVGFLAATLVPVGTLLAGFRIVEALRDGLTQSDVQIVVTLFHATLLIVILWIGLRRPREPGPRL